MKTFIASDRPARFGAGQTIGLTAGQFAGRAHNVERVGATKVGEAEIQVVKALAPIEFKRGERIYLPDDKPIVFIDPLSGQKLTPEDAKRVAAAKAKGKRAAAPSPRKPKS